MNDYDEIFVYFTDPLVADTDQDGLEDYDDVKLGFSPIKKDTDENGIIDSQEIVSQIFEQDISDSEKPAVVKVSVEMSTSGNIEKTTAISNVNNIDVLSTNVVGLVGVPVEINSSSPFDEATITFWYNKDDLGDIDENDLAVMWYDKENSFYKLLDEGSVIDTEKGTVSYTTTHFSTYMLVDKTQWYAAWKENLDYRTAASDNEVCYDFAFVIDVSGSMIGARIENAKQGLNGFIDALSERDEACIIKFNSEATVVHSFSSDKTSLHNAVSELSASGSTNVNNGLLSAISQYQNRSESNREQVIILLCDGDVNYYEDTIWTCVQRGITIHTVNVAYQSSMYLKRIARLTRGEYYYCPTAGSIETVFGEMRGDILEGVDPTDTDGDGLFDVYETVGIRMINGEIIKTDPNLADTDGDGLTDYEEVGIVYSKEQNIGSELTSIAKYVLMASHPLRVDTDGDGKPDPDDERPWDYDVVNDLLLYQSEYKKGRNPQDSDTADDLKTGDQSRQEISAINKLFEFQLVEADSDIWGPNTLFSEFQTMSTSLFSTGKLQKVILDMISHFKDGTGSDYVNEDLVEAAYKHESTQKYLNDITSEISRRLSANGGNIYDLEYKEELREAGDSLYLWIKNNTDEPTFKNTSDIVSGLTICVNDTWGTTIEVKNFSCNGEHFSGSLHFCIYDHFGLDRPDVEKVYVDLAGFRAWYVLQHYDQFNSAYVPFVTLMEYDVPFEGDVLVSKTK